MAAYDLRLDVPARFYINAQLLSLLEQGGTLWDAKKHLFAQEPYARTLTADDVYHYRPHDHSLAIAGLFCTIVVPREFLELPANHSIFRELDTERVTDLFNAVQPPAIDAYRFLGYLRNSVAHALFSITELDGASRYEFWTDREPVFRASITHHDLIKFISIVGVRLTNAALTLKSSDEGAT